MTSLPLSVRLKSRLRGLKDWGLGRPTQLVDRYQRAREWVHHHTVPGAGVKITNRRPLPYPEVSGYYIPTLLKWGERELALRYARWLVAIQNQDGSWSDAEGKASYTFDTGQILKGLLA